ncbi:MAG: adenosine kinase [Rhodospirillales bacterium]|nr:adenosine kinase [Rhodospirillales bacterium]MCW8863073.1 adenosine kinase [Rhodospirillales bacterium]MCW8951684.1 adenosine kinase [Rhodospirillales bacterium]MCW8971459.1 adenosine kinase [Rhodospirillales bacterium]MCW9001876.1 adenosine kinase [Rhodospirillales bacterium]
MTAPRFDVIAIGNAIVDVLAHADDDFLAANQLPKGAMTLIGPEQAAALYDRMGPGVECSGGSAANTVAALASLGGSAAFIGKVRDDQLGNVFAHDIRAAGVDFTTPAATEGSTTGRCLIFVTPDAQRTMQTFLGVAVELGPDDIDHSEIAEAQVTYLEGYLWDPPKAKEAFVKAALSAHQAGREVALSLSDPFCVDRHRESFLDLVNHHVDVLFANEDEIKSLYQVDSFDKALQAVRGHCRVAALTRSERGSVVISGDEVHILDAEKTTAVVDTTGAGDAYAAGFLFGLTRDADLATCGRMGGIASAEVISHFGARPVTPLDQLVADKLGL